MFWENPAILLVYEEDVNDEESMCTGGCRVSDFGRSNLLLERCKGK